MSTPTYLFHYTDPASLEKIYNSGHIKMSTDTSRDAAFGVGVYLTQISPYSSTEEIVKNNWDDLGRMQKAISEKTEGVIMIPTSAIPGVKKIGDTKRDIWVYPKELHLKGKGVVYLTRK